MIEALVIKNFEGYKKASLIFDKGVNVIVGESDHGKSSIIRALKWVILNRPSGDEFISYWNKDNTFVKIRVDGQNVKRVKGKENSYYINSKKYTAFGMGIPEDVQEIFNISDVNIQSQLDPHFLLSKSSGEVARYFNQIVNLDIIHQSLSNAQKCRQRENQQLNHSLDEKKELEDSLKEYDWLISAEDDVRKLENLNRTINNTSNTISEITSLMEEIKEVKDNIIPLENLLKAEEEIHELYALSNEIYSNQQEYEETEELMSSIEELQKVQEELMDLLKAKDLVESLMKLSENIERQKEEYKEVESLIWSVKSIKSDIDKTNKKKKDLEKELKKSMPEICPLCEQEIK